MNWDGYWLAFVEPQTAAARSDLLALLETELGIDPSWVDFADDAGRHYADGEWMPEMDEAVREHLRANDLSYLVSYDYLTVFWRPGFAAEQQVEYAIFRDGRRPLDQQAAARLAEFEQTTIAAA